MYTHLEHKEFSELIDIFRELTGIHYSREKLYLFENRLSKFVGITGNYSSYTEFIEELRNPDNKQLREQFVNQLTTNYTYFFREPVHFRFLQYLIKEKFKDKEELRLWSAAASGGHEAYSMAMSIDAVIRGLRRYKILGTDIAADKIEMAKAGIYKSDEVVGHMHNDTINKYFLEVDHMYQVKKRIKNNVKFGTLNIMEPYPFKNNFNIIFLRNIMIYFKNEEKEIMLNKIADYLEPDGYLIISLSESLTGLKVPFKHIKHGIYKKLTR